MPGLVLNPDVLADLVPFTASYLAQRDPGLPDVFVYQGVHPQRMLRNSTVGTTYVVFVDASDAGKRKEREFGKKLGIPLGRERMMSEQFGMLHNILQAIGTNSCMSGLIRLRPGDWLMARRLDTLGDPFDDMLQIIVAWDRYALLVAIPP